MDSAESKPGEALELEPPPVVLNRFLFVDIAALRAKQLRRGAQPRFDLESEALHTAPRKAERVAMEEVRRRLVQFDLPPAQLPVRDSSS